MKPFEKPVRCNHISNRFLHFLTMAMVDAPGSFLSNNNLQLNSDILALHSFFTENYASVTIIVGLLLFYQRLL